MLDNVASMFDEMRPMMKKLKKASYERNMRSFREQNNHYLMEMSDYVSGAQDREAALLHVAKVFTESVRNRFAVRDRIAGKTQADINFFMIYYVFPAILLMENENAEKIAEAIREEWGKRFKNSKIGYADYDTIYGAFREKIFGIF